MAEYLVVKEIETGKEVKRIEVGSVDSRKGEKVLAGLLRNMDTERFYVDEEKS